MSDAGRVNHFLRDSALRVLREASVFAYSPKSILRARQSRGHPCKPWCLKAPRYLQASVSWPAPLNFDPFGRSPRDLTKQVAWHGILDLTSSTATHALAFTMMSFVPCAVYASRCTPWNPQCSEPANCATSFVFHSCPICVRPLRSQ